MKIIERIIEDEIKKMISSDDKQFHIEIYNCYGYGDGYGD